METLGDGRYTVFMDDLSGELNNHFAVGDNVTSMMVISEAKKQTIRFKRMFPSPLGFYIPVGNCAPVSYFKLEKSVLSK